MESVYLHIGNGGITFIAGTDSEGHLAIQIEATHMGNTTNSMKILTNADSMQKIGEMLIEAAKEEHEVYVCAATVPEVTSIYGNGHESSGKIE